jgi:hypothetical protein
LFPFLLMLWQSIIHCWVQRCEKVSESIVLTRNWPSS